MSYKLPHLVKLFLVGSILLLQSSCMESVPVEAREAICSSGKLPKWLDELSDKLTSKVFLVGLLWMWEEIDDIDWSFSEYNNVWKSLVDTAESFSVILEKVKRIDSISKPYDSYFALSQVWSLKFCQNELIPKPELKDSLTLAFRKLRKNITLLYKDKIVYHCIYGSWFPSEYIFLENGEVRTYSSFYIGSMKKKSWYTDLDIIYLVDEDTVLQFVEAEKELLPYPDENSNRKLHLLKVN